MYKFCFYVPESHVDAVKQAVFAVGAGRIGNYDCCCWQIKGQGQFRPLAGSKPFIGKPGEPDGAGGQLEPVTEYKVEMVCDPEKVNVVLAAFRQAHPYEEPAFDFMPILQIP